MKIAAYFTAILALAVFSGCSTPEARIKRNPDVFARLTPAEQQLIREGKVAIGFTPEMVRLALGDPDRMYTRTDERGVNETWSYTTYESDDGMLLYRGHYHRFWRHPAYPYYAGYSGWRDREYFRVVFTDGRVSAIEQQS